MKGDTDALLDLVRRRSSSVLEPNDEGWVALHEAAHYGHLPSISILLNGEDGTGLKLIFNIHYWLIFIGGFRFHWGYCLLSIFMTEDVVVVGMLFLTLTTLCSYLTIIYMVNLSLFSLTKRMAFDLCLSSAYPDTVNKRTLKNQTALLLSARQGHVSCADFLLKRGADPNIPNVDRETPLFLGKTDIRAWIQLYLSSSPSGSSCILFMKA